MASDLDRSRLLVQIRSFLGELFPATRRRPPADDDDLLTSGTLDSVGVLDLVSRLEENLGIHILDEELVPENFRSIAAIATFVQAKRTLSPSPSPESP